MKKEQRKMTDELPCARCKSLTTAFYNGDGFQVKMCQTCIDEGWRPQMLYRREHQKPVLLCFCQTEEPIKKTMPQPRVEAPCQ